MRDQFLIELREAVWLIAALGGLSLISLALAGVSVIAVEFYR